VCLSACVCPSEETHADEQGEASDLVCPMARYENTSPERVELVFFCESELGQLIYSWRSKSVEPLFEQIRTCSASTLSL
jgi:hypothetical protein